jgi:Spy/CpxP family protein refolding chaperone
MKTSKRGVHNILLAAAMAFPLFALTSVARADDQSHERPPMMHGEDRHDGPEAGPGQGPASGPRFGSGFGPGRPPFHGVDLTEAQEDKIFAILHAEAPYLREQARAAAKAREALHALARADKYDDAQAAALAKSAATASANVELQHVRTQQKLLAVLTPEQRQKQAEDKPGRPPRP